LNRISSSVWHMVTAVLRTRLETSVLGYDHIPDA